jgi:hypothetical protein
LDDADKDNQSCSHSVAAPAGWDFIGWLTHSHDYPSDSMRRSARQLRLHPHAPETLSFAATKSLFQGS